MSNYDKYIKYKNKYLNFKKMQRGGQRYPVEDEIYFWSRQLMEHLMIIHLGLAEEQFSLKTGLIRDRDLKKEAGDLQKRWKVFIDDTFGSKGIKPGLDQVFLTQQELAKLDDIDMNTVNRLIDATDKYKSHLLTVLESGLWVGYIYPAMVEHMLQETLYFRRKLNGPAYTPQEEILYINNHHGTEIAATAQMIDPNPLQQRDIDITRAYANKTMSLLKLGGSPIAVESTAPFPRQWNPRDEEILKGLQPSDEATLLAISLKYSQELTDYAHATGIRIDAGELKSIIHPLLAHHEYREFVRFTNTLEKLAAQR
ncbi:hypothetical protein [Saudi moumouvirus]|nr:hypothetical protein [Saudi moumouvirus]